MQDPKTLSTHYRTLRPLKPLETTDERLEDQLDRLNVSVQQVLAGAKALQLDDLDYSSAHVSATITPRYRMPIDYEEELDEGGLKTPVSDEEEESLEIIEYLVGLLEKTQMEAEDVRGQAVRLVQMQAGTAAASEQRVIKDLEEALGLRKHLESSSALVTEVQGLLQPQITCSMEQLCACEMSLCELLQNHSQDAEVTLSLGPRAFQLRVKRSDGDMLAVAKQRLGRNIGQPLLSEREIVAIEPEEEQTINTIGHDHSDCERQIEELQLRMEFMREQILPAEIFAQVEQERQQLRRAEYIRRQETERLEARLRDLEELRTNLKSSTEEIKIVKELLVSEQQTVADLKSRLTQERLQLQEKTKAIEAEQESVAAEKANFINFASQQGTEVMTLKQKIERMINSSHPEHHDEVRSIPESLPDGELRDFDLRLKQMSTLIEKGDISSDVIHKELEEVEEELARVNPRRSGVRRLKIQLASAKNKLMGLKSRQAIAGADRMMANLSSSIQALEKTWNQSEVRQSPSKVLVKALPSRKPVDVLFPVTPTKSYEPQSSQATEEKDPYGKWMNYTETIRTQEHAIAKLKKQLLHAAHKAKDLENREVRLGEKEAVLRALEKQLESLNISLEKRVKAITVKETGLKAREVNLLEAADAENKEAAARSLYLQLEAKVRSEESGLVGQMREIEHEKMKLLAMREDTVGREKHLVKVQRILARENLRMEKEKKKLESLRQELSHLLPSLQSLAKPKN